MSGWRPPAVGTPFLIVWEHTPGTFALQPDEAAFLQRDYGNRLNLAIAPGGNTYTIHPRQHVGFIVLPTGRVLEIRPKVQVGTLFSMLARVYQIADFDTQSISYSSVAEHFEFITAFFVKMVEDLATRGLHCRFETREDELIALRGKLLLTETVRSRPIVRDRHWCAFADFTPDIAENRILKLTCGMLTDYPFRCIPDLPVRLWRLIHLLEPVSTAPQAPQHFGQIIYCRTNEHYRPALSLARMLLAYLSPSGSAGQHPFLSFLVDMNKLFEEYVTVTLREQSKGATDIQIEAQKSRSLDVAGEIAVRPDVVVYRGQVPCVVVDAKYKRAEHNADVYQAVAYAHALRVHRVILAYPLSEALGQAQHLIRPDAAIEIRTEYLDLSGSPDELSEHASIFSQRIWDAL